MQQIILPIVFQKVEKVNNHGLTCNQTLIGFQDYQKALTLL